MKDYMQSMTRTETAHRVRFFDYPDGGYSFECDENGAVDVSRLPEMARKNYENAMAHPEMFPYGWNEVETITRTVRTPASGKCNCGKRIQLVNEYMGACRCPRCGQWWNLFGQELLDPKFWEE